MRRSLFYGGQMKVSVNLDKCVGIGMCEVAAPNVFEVGDDGQSHVLVDEIAEADVAGVKQAVANCPTEALTIQD
ncbi:Ferredoxin [Mycobacterium talmoniae]|uniref:Ferredoxin n=2 Tax=Mycobacterium talmoniae TaxID=1858794 RepID=A0A2S8BH66_9MYCO|nr:Ferredoxin [Mycobacterium talmoniae]